MKPGDTILIATDTGFLSAVITNMEQTRDTNTVFDQYRTTAPTYDKTGTTLTIELLPGADQ